MNTTSRGETPPAGSAYQPTSVRLPRSRSAGPTRSPSGRGSGADVGPSLPLLATYLEHADPASTYWYLHAAPELLALAVDRLNTHNAKDQR